METPTQGDDELRCFICGTNQFVMDVSKRTREHCSCSDVDASGPTPRCGVCQRCNERIFTRVMTFAERHSISFQSAFHQLFNRRSHDLSQSGSRPAPDSGSSTALPASILRSPVAAVLETLTQSDHEQRCLRCDGDRYAMVPPEDYPEYDLEQDPEFDVGVCQTCQVRTVDRLIAVAFAEKYSISFESALQQVYNRRSYDISQSGSRPAFDPGSSTAPPASIPYDPDAEVRSVEDGIREVQIPLRSFNVLCAASTGQGKSGGNTGTHLSARQHSAMLPTLDLPIPYPSFPMSDEQATQRLGSSTMTGSQALTRRNHSSQTQSSSPNAMSFHDQLYSRMEAIRSPSIEREGGE